MLLRPGFSLVFVADVLIAGAMCFILAGSKTEYQE
jgi:hypothetical protein